LIRKLFDQDKKMIADYIAEDPVCCVPLSAPLELYGCDHFFSEFYAVLDNENSCLQGILGRYFGGYTFYSREPAACAEEVAQFLYMAGSGAYLQGSKNCVQAVLNQCDPNRPLSPNPVASKLAFFDHTCSPFSADRAWSAGNSVRLMQTDGELRAVYRLLCEIDEFKMLPLADYLWAVKGRYADFVGRVWAYCEGQRVLSTACTQIEGGGYAIVDSVATSPERRGEGLSTKVIAHLCGELTARELTPVVVYDSSQVGAFYRNVGFVDQCEWIYAPFGDK
jgi:GNAT superfamily N-acetyltransferase